ncbi:hypothetical protein [Streptomyces sp. NBC_00878]|uniref:hypothetical protein n=1 Tax=Streptomyces sp. NBC_00878 TaxID=2975854 RepID=UPI002259B76C|nr:hypothetical protein [Streptomyces sp. NBC_00878]MCX4911907.1 hypothetical protein [Streptomyces sp. NBC_00878]
MPAPRDDKRIELLHQASAHCRETGRPDLAEGIDFVFTEEGAKFLNRMRWGAVASDKPNLAISVTPQLRADLKALASEKDSKLEKVVREGFARYIAGDWVPPEPVKAARGAGVQKVNLNIRTDAEQRALMRELKPERSEELGFQVPDAWVALAWLLEEFGLNVEDYLQ